MSVDGIRPLHSEPVNECYGHFRQTLYAQPRNGYSFLALKRRVTMDRVLKSLKNTEQELLYLMEKSEAPEQMKKTLACIRDLITTLEESGKTKGSVAQ